MGRNNVECRYTTRSKASRISFFQEFFQEFRAFQGSIERKEKGKHRVNPRDCCSFCTRILADRSSRKEMPSKLGPLCPNTTAFSYVRYHRHR